MRYFLFLLGLIIISYNCNSLKTKNIKKEIDVQILNSIIKLPLNDQTICMDTLIFEISNNSNFEYIFDITDTTGFYFFMESTKEDSNLDPCGGFGIGFIDGKGKNIDCNGNSVYHPEGFDNVVIKEVVYQLLPKKSIIIKVPLVFPSKLIYGNYIQEISDLKHTKNVEIFFRPENGYLKNILIEKNEFKLKKNQRIMNISQSFVLPVEFNSCSSRP